MERRISRGERPGPRYCFRAMGPLLSLLLCLVLIALPIAGCGGGGGGTSSNGGTVPTPNQGATPKVAGDADPADVRVIDGWATTLRHGDADAAAAYFAIPSVAENGVLIHIRSLHDARHFNKSLPCGARLIRRRDGRRFHDRDLPPHRAPRARPLRNRHRADRADLVRDPRRQDRRVAPRRPAGRPGGPQPVGIGRKDPASFKKDLIFRPRRDRDTASQGHIRLEWERLVRPNTACTRGEETG